MSDKNVVLQFLKEFKSHRPAHKLVEMTGAEEFIAKDIDINYQDVTYKATVKWYFDMEMRDYGVKGFNFVVPDQSVTVYNDETDEEKVLNINNVNISTYKRDEFNGLYLDQLSFYKGKWSADFIGGLGGI